MPKLYWESIEKGEQVTPVSKPAVTRVQIAKFAGASQDWSPLHLDDDFAKSAGYGGVFAHGAIALQFATEALGKWLENGRVLSVSGRFRKLVWPGDILRMTGMVAEKYESNGEARVDVDVWAENQNHDSVMQGTITCVMWRNEKDEKKSKSPFPPVAPQTIKDRRTGKPIPKNEADAAKAREAAAAAERARPQAANPPRQVTKPAPAAPKAAPAPAPAKAAPTPQKAAPAKPAAAAAKPAPKGPPPKPAKPAPKPAKAAPKGKPSGKPAKPTKKAARPAPKKKK
jgi:acyl dehydratase